MKREQYEDAPVFLDEGVVMDDVTVYTGMLPNGQRGISLIVPDDVVVVLSIKSSWNFDEDDE